MTTGAQRYAEYERGETLLDFAWFLRFVTRGRWRRAKAIHITMLKADRRVMGSSQ